MDQGPLVSERIDAGKLVIEEFDKKFPIAAAFWLRESESDFWYLYLASPGIDDMNTRDAYREVVRIVPPADNVWLDPFQVKVVGADSPVAKDVIGVLDRHHSKSPIRFGGHKLGGLSVDDVYIYPRRNGVRSSPTTAPRS